MFLPLPIYQTRTFFVWWWCFGSGKTINIISCKLVRHI